MKVARIEERFPFVAQISEDARAALRQLAVSEAKAKQPLLEPGAVVSGAYLLVGGAIRVYYVAASGREGTLYHVEPGGTCILALTATFRDERYPAWAEAGRDGAQFVCVERAQFRALFDRETAFREFVFGALSGRVFSLMCQLEDLASASVEQRVAQFLLRNADQDGVVSITQTALASELGTAREVVYRALASLSDRAMIRTGRMRIALIDRAAVERVAERCE